MMLLRSYNRVRFLREGDNAVVIVGRSPRARLRRVAVTRAGPGRVGDIVV